MSSLRKQTQMGPGVGPAAQAPPVGDDDDMPAESTVVDEVLANQLNERWEESTVSEKQSSSKRKAVPPAQGSRPTAPPAAAHRPVQEDSAQVLLDTVEEEQRALPTAVNDHPLSNMPTAISQNSLQTQTRHGTAGKLIVIGGNDRGREFVLTARETSLGRGADNDIILTDIAVSRRHIILLFDGNRYGVRDLGSGNGTLCNGMKIQGDIFVHDGDQLELGNTLLRFENPNAQSQVAPPPISGPPPPMSGPAHTSDGASMPLPASPSGAYPNYDPSMIPPGAPGSVWPQQPVGPPPVAVFDLNKAQRKRLFMLGGGLLLVGALVGVLVAVTSTSPKGKDLVSTEAAKKPPPAMSALMTNVDATHGATDHAAQPTPQPQPQPVPPQPQPVAHKDPQPQPPPPQDPTPPQQDPTPPVHDVTPPRHEKQIASVTPRHEPVHRDPPPVDTAPKGASGAEKAAAALYKDKQFDKAAETLRTQAAKETGATADRLTGLARDYAAVGAALAKGDANATSAPTTAMSAYQGALNVDQHAGHGIHAAYIKAQLAKVAPRAAQQYYAAQQFEQARSACDTATAFGAGSDPTVVKIRASLEAKAKDMYGQGVKIQKSKPTDAKAMFRRVLKMVPADSPTYTKAYAALNKPSKTSDDDEDE